LFLKHFVRHPLLPDRDGTSTSREIRYRAVHEMYQFCFQRGLREVWAYMWESWYSPKMWPLWARSSSPTRLSRLRTTMTTENFWKQLKHDWMHYLVHPRLDQLVWIISTKVVPSYMARAATMDTAFRAGRARSLLTCQAAMKKAWRELS
ncbi:hypothetical protein CYLTODRAFT_322908, partial [Cylindrobasidium torrendii FP15055 ss-10]